MNRFSTIPMIFGLIFFFASANEKAHAQTNQNIFLNAAECVDIESGSTQTNSRLIIAPCSPGSSTQMFSIVRSQTGGFTLVNSASGLCIDVPNADQNDGTIIQQFPCTSAPQQIYLLGSSQNFNNQQVISGPINVSHSGKCLDARFRPYVRQYPCNNSANQNFEIKSFSSSQNTKSNAQFLNGWAADTKVKLPLTVGDIQITDAIVNTTADYLEIRGWTPRLAAGKQRNDLANALKPFLLTDYCNSGAVQRNIRLLSRTFDSTQTDGYFYWINPGDCPMNIASNPPINVPPISTTPSNTGVTNQSGIEDQYWNAVKNSTSAADFQGYLNNYPTGQYAALARLRISQLGGSISNPPTQISNLPGGSGNSPVSSIEQQYWDAVKNSSNAQDFQNYLRDYPSGQFVPIARLKISQLGGNPAVNPTNNFSAEDQYWNNVRNSSNARDFQGYLNIYPRGKYSAIARLKVNQLSNSSNINNPPNLNNPPNINTNNSNNNRGAQILSKAQFGSLNEMLALRKFWVMTENGDLESKQIITQELMKAFPKLITATSEQDAEFFVLLSLTNEATGAIITGSSIPNNQTHAGEMMVFTSTPGNNNVPNIRILFKTEKKQFFSASGGTFNRHPATNAAREFAKELQKINF